MESNRRSLINIHFQGLLIIFLLFVAISGRAQDRDKYIRLGVIANLTEEPNIYGPSVSYITQTLSGNRQEFSLEHVFWQKNVQDEVTNYQMRSQVGYLYDVHFMKNSNIQPYLGLGLLFSGEYEFYDFGKFTPQFNEAYTNLTSSLLIAPSLHIKRDNWFLDVGFRYHIASFFYSIYRDDNLPDLYRRTGFIHLRSTFYQLHFLRELV